MVLQEPFRIYKPALRYAEQASAPGSSENAAIITAKALSQIMLGQYSEAETTLKEALAVNPKYDEALAAQVALAELGGKSSESESALRYARVSS